MRLDDLGGEHEEAGRERDAHEEAAHRLACGGLACGGLACGGLACGGLAALARRRRLRCGDDALVRRGHGRIRAPREEGDGADRHVREGGGVHGPAHAERGEDQVRARERARGAARRVDGVEAREPRRAPLAFLAHARDDAREERERRAHRDGRHEHDERRERGARERDRGERARRVPRERDVGVRQERERRRRCRAHEADDRLERAVGHERARGAARVLAAEVRAEREARHERREHRAHCVRRRAEDVGEELRERDLVEQARGARDEEQRRDEGEAGTQGARTIADAPARCRGTAEGTVDAWPTAVGPPPPRGSRYCGSRHGRDRDARRRAPAGRRRDGNCRLRGNLATLREPLMTRRAHPPTTRRRAGEVRA